MRIKRIHTGVAYDHARDSFSVPVPESPDTLAIARGEDVRSELDFQLPYNGAELRDVIIELAHAWASAS